jgi:hypothetical protein
MATRISALSPDYSLNAACEAACDYQRYAAMAKDVGSVPDLVKKCNDLAKEWAWKAYLYAQR